jgi:hypothetical protein
VTVEIVRRARIDEARHVAFGVEHARHYLRADPDRVTELFKAVRRRASFVADASGTSPHIEEALVILAAGEVTPSRIREGSRRSARCRRRCTGDGSPDSPSSASRPRSPRRCPRCTRRTSCSDPRTDLGEPRAWRYGTMAAGFPPPTLKD